jgi:hypothetical protein
MSMVQRVRSRAQQPIMTALNGDQGGRKIGKSERERRDELDRGTLEAWRTDGDKLVGGEECRERRREEC